MQVKKTLSVALSIVIVSTIVLAGCSKSTETPQASTEGTSKQSFPLKEKVTLNMAACKHASSGPFAEMSFYKQMEEKTNVHINWQDIENAQCLEKKNLLLASGDLPDAFYGSAILTTNDVISNGEQGVLIPLEKYITKETMPNLFGLLEKHPHFKSAITTPNGHIYSLPNVREMLLWLSPDNMFINKVWLDKLGLAMPSTTEELYHVLQEFKTKDPNGNGKNDEIPFSFVFSNDTLGIGSLFGALGRADWSKHLFIENGKVVHSADKTEYKNAINYFHKFMANGLFDKESLTQDLKQLIAKGTAKEEVLGGFFAWSSFTVAGAQREGNFVTVPVLKGPTGDQIWKKNMANNQGVNPVAFTVTSANKNPELTLRWVDQMYDTMTSLEQGFGPIGKTIEDKGGKLVFKKPPEGQAYDQFVYSHTLADSPYVILEETYGTKIELSIKDTVKIDDIKKYYLPYMKSETYPLVFYTKEENKVIQTYETDINNYIKQSSAKWLLEGGVDREWDAYVKKLQEMKLSEVTGVYQKAYDRFKSVK
jgi:putative aldouronate transport system substrate-binding protein